MKTKSFVPPTKSYNNTKKTTDYWGMLFVAFIFLSSISCFLFANNVDRQSTRSVSDSMKGQSYKVIDTDQRARS